MKPELKKTGGNYKWLMLALLCCAFFIDQADRVLFGLLTVPMQADLHLTDVQIGMVQSALFYVIAVMLLVAGFVGDRFSRKWVITSSILLWSLVSILIGFADGVWSLVLLVGVALGATQSLYGPSAFALIGEHHKETRSFALSAHQAALYAGLMSSGAIVAFALKFTGWRQIYWIVGGVGIVLGVVCAVLLKDGVQRGGNAASPVVRKPGLLEAARTFLASRTALLTTGGYVAVIFANNIYVSWAPKFASVKFGVSAGEAGNGMMLYNYACAFVAILVCGLVTDCCVKRWPRTRIFIQAAALFLAAPTLIMTGFSGSFAGTCLATALFGLFRGCYSSNTQAVLFDVIPSRFRSTALGLLGMSAYFLCAPAPLLMGWLSSRYGIRGFEIGFAAAGVAYVVGGVLLVIAALSTFKHDKINE